MTEEFGVSPATLTVVFDGGGIPARSERVPERRGDALEDVREMDEVRRSPHTPARGPPVRLGGWREVLRRGGLRHLHRRDPQRGQQGECKVRSEELDTYVTGAPAVYQDLEGASNEDIKRAEKYAFPFALVILIIAFGTVVAAGVPVLIGGVSVLTALAVLYFVAASTTCPCSCLRCPRCWAWPRHRLRAVLR